jgi:hypothetical protein
MENHRTNSFTIGVCSKKNMIIDHNLPPNQKKKKKAITNAGYIDQHTTNKT